MTAVPDGAAARTSALLAALWRRNLPLLHERLTTLEYAAASAASGALSSDLRVEAAAIAHKLAGSLGMFGHHEATAIARRIEEIFEHPPELGSKHSVELVSLLRDSLPL